jgi:hypothetical protein
VKHEALDQFRLKLSQRSSELRDRLHGIAAAYPQTFTRNIGQAHHIDETTGPTQAKHMGPPPPAIQSRSQRRQGTLGTTDIQVGDHKRNRHGLIGPRVRKLRRKR